MFVKSCIVVACFCHLYTTLIAHFMDYVAWTAAPSGVLHMLAEKSVIPCTIGLRRAMNACARGHAAKFV